MKIINYDTPQYNKKSNTAKTTPFGGYFACPIKELHVQPMHEDKNAIILLKELQKKCGEYFRIIVQLGDRVTENIEDIQLDKYGYISNANPTKWGQDNKLFLPDGKTLAIFKKAKDYQTGEYLATALNMPKININAPIEGGNCFLGKKNTGEYFALIGNKNLYGNYIPLIAKKIGIKLENIHLISQPDIHIDLGIRPINYPYVLLGDRGLTTKLIKSHTHKLDAITQMLIESSENYHRFSYANTETIEKELIQNGFIPIRVPGLLGQNKINYMNAIVHQESNGDLIYITNDCQPYGYRNIDINNLFKKYLMEKVPKVKKVKFINGGLGYDGENYRTYTSFCLARTNGGIHCMSNERPDFEKWNIMA